MASPSTSCSSYLKLHVLSQLVAVVQDVRMLPFLLIIPHHPLKMSIVLHRQIVTIHTRIQDVDCLVFSGCCCCCCFYKLQSRWVLIERPISRGPILDRIQGEGLEGRLVWNRIGTGVQCTMIQYRSTVQYNPMPKVQYLQSGKWRLVDSKAGQGALARGACSQCQRLNKSLPPITN